LDLQALSDSSTDPSVAASLACGPFFADTAYQFNLPTGSVFHMPYIPGPTPGGPNIPCPMANAPAACTVTGTGQQITLVGLRPYSSPLCDPFANTGCPPDGIDVFSSIFTQNTISTGVQLVSGKLEKRSRKFAVYGASPSASR
jgi:hypothetical protein